ncbi:MAG: hypothetical protein MJD61_09420 [Proteobacteria bacterium]|nr:hypothetical protein [Pseudomonadota bacterium]
MSSERRYPRYRPGVYDCPRCGAEGSLINERAHPTGRPYVILTCRRCGFAQTLKRLDGGYPGA